MALNNSGTSTNSEPNSDDDIPGGATEDDLYRIGEQWRLGLCCQPTFYIHHF